MKIYLVGGYIRDRLLGFPANDRDWVVVGSTPKKMLQQKYQQVGRDFPVFIHPVTHEEYALARTEKKSGVGYSGFLFNFSPKITLKEDLIRRDLTINAIAQDENGKIIDLFNGQQDLKNRVLRHISDSFKEDPLRVLRVARFAAALSNLGFYIAHKTLCLMKKICNSGELLYLTPERVWRETCKGLSVSRPHVYFQVLHRCNALIYLFPEINFFINNCYIFNYNARRLSIIKYSFMELSRISKFTSNIHIRLSYFLQFFSHIYYISIFKIQNTFFDDKPVCFLRSLLKRLRAPLETQRLSFALCGFHNFLQTIEHQSSELIINFFNIIDVWRNPKRVDQLKYLNFYSIGVYKKIKNHILLGRLLQSMFFIVKDVSIHSFKVKNAFQGIKIRNELYRLRVKLLKQWRKR
ncbi:CCA-adding protein [Buchnera aphidicola]|uniref:CCA-adding protein n=1 Tax=Buchnera aphidicola TaxID=9 RepID=UPI00094C9F0F|nr:CCA-adding protein [Buchnera aphidicola]